MSSWITFQDRFRKMFHKCVSDMISLFGDSKWIEDACEFKKQCPQQQWRPNNVQPDPKLLFSEMLHAPT